MLIKNPSDIRPSEITSHTNYLNRREFIRAGAIAGGSLLTPAALGAIVPPERRAKLSDVGSSPFSTDEAPNSYEDITTYNNFYEFGTGKGDPVVYARDFKPRPWTITVDGHAEKTGTFDFEDFIKPFDLEERIYRLRCVEAWSMVIPWVGISLAEVIKWLQPTSRARYVAFETLNDPKQMPGIRRRILDWPYREGLTIEEATNPLTILAVGVYGEVMPTPFGQCREVGHLHGAVGGVHLRRRQGADLAVARELEERHVAPHGLDEVRRVVDGEGVGGEDLLVHGAHLAEVARGHRGRPGHRLLPAAAKHADR